MAADYRGIALEVERELRATRQAWAEQIVDLIPRVGLRALEGVPHEVRAIVSRMSSGRTTTGRPYEPGDGTP